MSQQPKWTPGPWGTEPENGTHESGPREWKVRIFAHDPGPDADFHIAIVRDPDTPTRQANARLIAAAPELYEVACMAEQVAAMELREGMAPDFEPRELLEKARAALAKARGNA